MTQTTDSDTGAAIERPSPWAAAPLAFVLAGIGVLALLIGLVTPWVDVNVDTTQGDAELQSAIAAEVNQEYGSDSPIGISLDDGPKIIVLSLAFIALLGEHHRRNRRGRGLPIAAFVTASLLAVTGIGNLMDLADKSEAVQQVLPVSLDTGFGLYFTILGAVLTMCCAALVTAKAEPSDSSDSVA